MVHYKNLFKEVTFMDGKCERKDCFAYCKQNKDRCRILNEVSDGECKFYKHMSGECNPWGIERQIRAYASTKNAI